MTLIHGDDLEKIEKEIVSFSSKGKVTRLDGVKIKLKELEEQLLGESLFGEQEIFIIENLFKNKSKKELLGFILSHKEAIVTVLIERKKLNKRDLGSYKFDSIVSHQLPQYYFKFLDELYPKNNRNLATYYSELLKSMTAEQIFYSVIKRLRALIVVKNGVSSHSEIARFAPWQTGKLKSQASFWQEDELINFYKQMFEIEKKMKTSSLPVTLEKYLDMTILTELN